MNKTRVMRTLKGEKARYKLVARTADGESLTRDGDVSLPPLDEASEIDSARLQTAPPGAIEGGAERSVRTALELTVAK